MLPETQARARERAASIRPAIDPQWQADKLLETREVAKILRVSESWLEKGRVYFYGPPYFSLRRPGSKVGAIRYRLSALLRWIDEQQCNPEEARHG